MLRTVRSGFTMESSDSPHGRSAPSQLLLAVAPPPSPHQPYSISGWPTWLIPAYRAGGHRPSLRLLEEER